MPNTVTDAFKALLALGTVPLAACVRVERADGVVFGFTQQQRALTLADYTPDIAGALTVPGTVYDTQCKLSNFVMTRDLTPNNFTLTTNLSAALLQGDIEGYLFDDAEWWLALPITSDLTAETGYLVMGHGFDCDVTVNGQEVIFEFRSLTNALTQQIMDKTSALCLNELGDSNCQVDLTGNMVDSSPIRVTSTVTSATDQRTFIVSATMGSASDKFANGLCKLTSGANAGISREVMSFDEASGAFLLRFPMPFAIAPGDGVVLTAGCLKTLIADCVGRFGNGYRNRCGGFVASPTIETVNESTN